MWDEVTGGTGGHERRSEVRSATVSIETSCYMKGEG